MERPADLFDREHEWNDLAEFVQAPGGGTRLALVRGRRRQGKSFLLRRLAAAADGFFYQAVQEHRQPALASFAAALSTHARLGPGRLGFDSWDEAIRALLEVPASPESQRPQLVIIDEFPYLLEHSPELASVIQRIIDDTRDPQQPPVRLILCGSALAVMARLLEGTQALRGRATTDLVVRPFDMRTAAQFWGIEDPTMAFMVHAVVGGTAGYRDLLPTATPREPEEFVEWLAAGPLNPSSAVFREDEYLLTEERSLSDRALYHSVVGAIAAGHTSQGAIARALGREATALQHPLRALVSAGFVEATQDALRARRPIYRISDPILRFHHVVTRRDLARFEDRRTREAWAEAAPRFSTHVLGPHFEQLAREFTARYAAPHTVGGVVAEVGPAVVNDARNRIHHAIDVVALGRAADGSQPVLALGEAKFTRTRQTLGDLHLLEARRALVARTHPSAVHARLLIFSGSDFNPELQATAQSREDVELIDLARMYGGD